MQRIDGTLIFSPSDLHSFLECEYLTQLEIEVAGGRVLEERRTAEADFVAAKGDAHERAYLAALRVGGLTVVEIADPHVAGWIEAARATRDAMRCAPDAIYQGVLIGDRWRGRADFLVRVDVPSALGSWSYDVCDTKLARHARPAYILQLAYYTEQVAAIQGLEPAWMHVVLGTGERARFRVRDFMAYCRSVRSRFLRSVERGESVSPYPVNHCGRCGYAYHCEERWDAEDHLSLVANIRRSQVDLLRDAGVRTMAGLAMLSSQPAGIGEVAFKRLRQQAALQTYFRTTGRHRYDLLPPTDENGLRLMPPPSPGDVFFDMEGFPFFEPSGGLEYLFGCVTVERGTPRFCRFGAADRFEEQRAFEGFMDFVWDRFCRWPDLHVYHYSHYEPDKLKKLAALHATREEELDELLRREAFVDLYQVVRRSIRISHANYSIKAVRQFFMPEAGKGEVAGGADSIVEFQRWLDTGDPQILAAIERYNEEDCVSTLKLRDWLLERRAEVERQFGVSIPFRDLPDRREEPVATEPEEHGDLRARLEAVGEPWATTLAHLLSYHRREAKPEWWAYFQRRRKSLDELLDDTDAIAYLTPASERAVRAEKAVAGPHARVPRTGIQAQGRCRCRRPAGGRSGRNDRMD